MAAPLGDRVRVVDFTPQFLAKFGAAEGRSLIKLATLYKNEVQRLMRESPASGRTYKRLRTRRATRRRLALGQKRTPADYIFHQASAPGEPPAIDNSRLVNSAMIEVRGDHVVAGSSLAKIPLALEFGRLDGTIKPRPAWRPAMRVLLGTDGQLRTGIVFREALRDEGIK